MSTASFLNSSSVQAISVARMLTYKTHVKSTKLRRKKRQYAMKAMAAKDIGNVICSCCITV